MVIIKVLDDSPKLGFVSAFLSTMLQRFLRKPPCDECWQKMFSPSERMR